MADLTPAQRAELKRLTRTMREILHQAAVGSGDVCHPFLHSARILERRGFVVIDRRQSDFFYDLRLTPAGVAACASLWPSMPVPEDRR